MGIKLNDESIIEKKRDFCNVQGFDPFDACIRCFGIAISRHLSNSNSILLLTCITCSEHNRIINSSDWNLMKQITFIVQSNNLESVFIFDCSGFSLRIDVAGG